MYVKHLEQYLTVFQALPAPCPVILHTHSGVRFYKKSVKDSKELGVDEHISITALTTLLCNHLYVCEEYSTLVKVIGSGAKQDWVPSSSSSTQ